MNSPFVDFQASDIDHIREMIKAYGGTTISEIVDVLEIDKEEVTEIVSALEEDELIYYVRSKNKYKWNRST